MSESMDREKSNQLIVTYFEWLYKSPQKYANGIALA